MKKYLPVLLIFVLMLGIFLFSAQRDTATNAVSYRFCDIAARMLYSKYDTYTEHTQNIISHGLNRPIRKLAHFILYALMGFLGYLWLHRRRFNILIVQGSITIFAALDEFHQTFVPGRTGKFSDVLLDSFGAASGIFAAFLLLCLLYCFRNRSAVDKGVWKT
jgi:VanZ family protein